MIVPFNIPHLFCPGSSKKENARGLNRLMTCLVQLDLDYLETHPTPGLQRAGLIYDRTIEWDTIPALYQRGYGDCKSLSAADIALRIKAGLQARPSFRFGPPPYEYKYHILEEIPGGYIDMSRVLGMGKNENAAPRGSRGGGADLSFLDDLDWSSVR